MIKQSIARQELTTGHARCLLSILEAQKQREAFRLVLSRGLSVRETEKLVKKLNRVVKNQCRMMDLFTWNIWKMNSSSGWGLRSR